MINILKILKMKRKLVKLVVDGIDEIKLYSGIVKETKDFIHIRQVVAGNFTGNVFYFRKNLKKVRKISNALNYYISEEEFYVTINPDNAE